MADEFYNPSEIPASTDQVKVADLEGCLLVLRPDGPESETDVNGKMVPYAPAQVLVVEGARELAGGWHALWVFQKALMGQLRRAGGKPVVCVLGKGQVKPGQSPPCLLLDPTPAQVEAARKAYLAAEVPF